jgi:hypothetical protein
MDKISEFWDSLKERLRNPLFASFVVSWIIFNWRIPIALFWYDQEKIKALGDYDSMIDYVYKNTSNDISFWYPLGTAIIYVILNPVFKNVGRLFTIWTKKQFDKLIFRVLEDAPVKYGIYQARLNEIQKIHNDLAESVNENKKKEGKLTDLEIAFASEKEQSYELEKQFRYVIDTKFVVGNWLISYPSTSKGNQLVHFHDTPFATAPTHPQGVPSGVVVNHYLLKQVMHYEKCLMIVAVNDNQEKSKKIFALEGDQDSGFYGYENTYLVRMQKLTEQEVAMNQFF